MTTIHAQVFSDNDDSDDPDYLDETHEGYLDDTDEVDITVDISGDENEADDPMSEEEQPVESDEPDDEPDEPLPRSNTRQAPPVLAEYLRGKPFIALGHIHRYLHKTYPDRISRKASAALIGVIQSLMLELITSVVAQVRNGKSNRISTKKLCMAIQQDEEFTKLLSHVTIPESGAFGIIGKVAAIPNHQLNRYAI